MCFVRLKCIFILSLKVKPESGDNGDNYHDEIITVDEKGEKKG